MLSRSGTTFNRARTAGRGATGSTMNLKHKTSQALFAYWNKVRADRGHPAPLRDRARQDRRHPTVYLHPGADRRGDLSVQACRNACVRVVRHRAARHQLPRRLVGGRSHLARSSLRHARQTGSRRDRAHGGGAGGQRVVAVRGRVASVAAFRRRNRPDPRRLLGARCAAAGWASCRWRPSASSPTS